jgi:hypothetical protein
LSFGHLNLLGVYTHGWRSAPESESGLIMALKFDLPVFSFPISHTL